MITKNDLNVWGVTATEGLAFDVFCTLCQIAGYLNKTSPQKPNKKDLALIPVEYLVEVADLIKEW